MSSLRRPRSNDDPDNDSDNNSIDDPYCDLVSNDSGCEDKWENLDEIDEKEEKKRELADHEEAVTRIPAELRNNDVVPQEYDAYMSSHPSSHRVSGKIDLAKEIDHIEGKLVAKLNIKELFRRISTNSFSQLQNFRRAMEILNGKSLPSLLAGDKEVQEARRKKKIREFPAPIQPMVSAALRYLMKQSNFLIGTRSPSKVLSKKKKGIISHCGAFFVKKSNGKLRVILDGRYANIYFKPSATSFAFFKLETLRNVIDNLSEKKEWYALNYDLRHWFHQIPMPRFYRSYLGMKLTDRKKGSRSRNFWAFPRSLPMGFIQAPYLAQNCAWGIVLTQPDGKNWNGSDIDSEYLDRIKDQGTPPSWIPLKSGGGIFVFLDNILVVTAKKSVAEWWENKIIRDCKELHAWLKSDNEEHDPEASVEEQKKTLSSCFVTLKEGSNDHFDFLGVRWCHNHRSVILKSDDERGKMPGLNDGGLLKFWKGSRREMAGILGKILWYRRVHGINYFDADSSQETRAILSLYQKLSPEVDHHQNSTGQIRHAWNEDFLDYTPEEIEGLEVAWNKRARGTISFATPQYRTKVQPSDIVFAITDAATGHGETGDGLAGGCWYEAGKDCFSKKASFKPDFETVSNTKTAVNFSKEDGIAFGEMLAIEETVRSLLNQREQRTQVIFLATDNLACKYWIEKGHAKDERMQQLLQAIHDVLQAAGCRLYVTYVNTEFNFADEISRGKALERGKLQHNHKLLMGAVSEALSSMWMVAGGRVGGNAPDLNQNK